MSFQNTRREVGTDLDFANPPELTASGEPVFLFPTTPPVGSSLEQLPTGQFAGLDSQRAGFSVRYFGQDLLNVPPGVHEPGSQFKSVSAPETVIVSSSRGTDPLGWGADGSPVFFVSTAEMSTRHEGAENIGKATWEASANGRDIIVGQIESPSVDMPDFEAYAFDWSGFLGSVGDLVPMTFDFQTHAVAGTEFRTFSPSYHAFVNAYAVAPPNLAIEADSLRIVIDPRSPHVDLRTVEFRWSYDESSVYFPNVPGKGFVEANPMDPRVGLDSQANISFYWSASADIRDKLALAYEYVVDLRDSIDNDRGVPASMRLSGQLKRSDYLRSPPADATHLIMHLDSQNRIMERNESDNYAAIDIRPDIQLASFTSTSDVVTIAYNLLPGLYKDVSSFDISFLAASDHDQNPSNAGWRV